MARTKHYPAYEDLGYNVTELPSGIANIPGSPERIAKDIRTKPFETTLDSVRLALLNHACREEWKHVLVRNLMHARSGGLHHLCQATAIHRVQVCYLALADQAELPPQDSRRLQTSDIAVQLGTQVASKELGPSHPPKTVRGLRAIVS